MGDHSRRRTPKRILCKVCTKPEQNKNGIYHCKPTEHELNTELYNIYKNWREATDRFGVIITASTKNVFETRPLAITQDNRQYICTLTLDELHNEPGGITFTFEVEADAHIDVQCILIREIQYFQLTKDESPVFEVNFNTDCPSTFKTMVNFVCTNTRTKEKIRILRDIVIHVLIEEIPNTEDEEDYYPSIIRNAKNIVDCSSRSPISDIHALPTKFTDLLNEIRSENFRDYEEETYYVMKFIWRLLNCGPLTKDNYKYYFRNSLWLDELGASIKIKKYNMENTKVTLRNQNVVLKVNGLAEKRPSLMKGDHVLIHVTSSSENDIHDGRGLYTFYRGIITIVGNKDIEIDNFNPQFLDLLQNPDTLVNVEFEIGRLIYQQMHTVVDNMDNDLVHFLFPERTNFPAPMHEFDPTLSDINNPSTAENEQDIAVRNIVSGLNFAPYIVFGPPGTGKTLTIIKAIKQISDFPHSKILVCAPTNALCDKITSDLMDVFGTNEMLRYVSKNAMDSGTMSEELRQYATTGQLFARKINKYKIIITTLIKSGSLPGKYKPTHVFIDEAAQASEPEALVPISRILRPNGRLVLSGDPKQLAPIGHSSFAGQSGLAKSLLSRLMEMPVYDLTNPNSLITKLKLNYRNHVDILHIPNTLFYDGELEAKSDHRYENLPFMNCAIEFCGVVGQEERRGKFPSYFNKAEINVVMNYIIKLTTSKSCTILPEEIGVIAPYKRQCVLIQNEISKLGNYEKLEVGSVEVFQGKEKRVIIISTVRAQANLLLHDMKYNIGFLNDEKRFNVAITRAQSKLIVVGNPVCLYTNKNWEAFIDRCEELGSYRGFKITKKTAEAINKILNNLKL